MSAKVHLHLTLRQHTNGQEVVEAEGATVGECLKDVIKSFPGLESALFDRRGKLNNVVEIYLNMQSAYPDELAKRVKDGDQIHVTLMLAGG